jgi:hypothetical protein
MSHSGGISFGSPRPPDIACLLERAVDLYADLDVIEASVVNDNVSSSDHALSTQDGPDCIESGNDVRPEGTARRGPADRCEGSSFNAFDTHRRCHQLVRKISE